MVRRQLGAFDLGVIDNDESAGIEGGAVQFAQCFPTVGACWHATEISSIPRSRWEHGLGVGFTRLVGKGQFDRGVAEGGPRRIVSLRCELQALIRSNALLGLHGQPLARILSGQKLHLPLNERIEGVVVLLQCVIAHSPSPQSLADG